MKKIELHDSASQNPDTSSRRDGDETLIYTYINWGRRERKEERVSEKKTYTPAMANGLVNSKTRWPASRPCPSTCMTMKSSLLIDIRELAVGTIWLNFLASGAKYCSANCLEQIIEHSTGVIERFRKPGDWNTEALACSASLLVSWLSIAETSLNRSCRIGCRKKEYRSSGIWTRASRSSIKWTWAEIRDMGCAMAEFIQCVEAHTGRVVQSTCSKMKCGDWTIIR